MVMMEMSPGRRLGYALVISLLIHFFVLAPLFGGGKGGRGGPRSYAGTLAVDLIDLTVSGAHAGVAPAEPEPAEAAPAPPVAVEETPVPPAPVAEPEIPSPAVNLEKKARSHPPVKAMPSLSTESSEGGEAGPDRGPGTGKEGLTGQGGLGIFPAEPASATTSEPASPPDAGAGGVRNPRVSRPGSETPAEGAAPAPVVALARCASCPPPPYPPLALERGLEGEIVLTVQVLDDGNVGDVYIEKSPGIPILETAAITAVKGWTFYPATEDGAPVASSKRVVIPFTLTPR
jgi:periplasmic protein TonB